jgi:hypothetical protein
MQNGKINRWAALAGFAVLVAGLSLEAVAVYETYTDRGFVDSSGQHPEPMMRFLFDRVV